ncbi:carotenoid 1,2-hydratase [Vibrio sp. HA2012]|uniref:lipocalin-like domain-containing protein n=1 Tax=Vibrio sp. HA2012 TaxID=1971595 RepID=UPI000C2BBE0D|nr:lipocalin-like domain-containing protein [Vibrio sp. HA2012]PJC87755.1 carotenoid 1,2-hydratase [Vibrio sp. HA2012]
MLFSASCPWKKHILTAAILLVVVALLIILNVSFPVKNYPASQESGSNRVPETVFDIVSPEHPLSLPDDFRFHPGYQNEVWRFFADLIDAKGQRYTIQWNYYRIAQDSRTASGWQNSQLYVAQVVVTAGKRVWREQRLARGGIGQSGFRAHPFRLWIDNWSWHALGAAPFPGMLNISSDDFSVQINMSTAGAYVLDGLGGYQKQHDIFPMAAYQLSAPFLDIAGELTLEGLPVPVKGRAHLTKVWGNNLINNGAGHQDEFVLHLNDGRSLALHRVLFRHHAAFNYGTLADRQGNTIYLQNKDVDVFPESYTDLSDELQIPVRWIISVPEHHIRLTVSPDNSELWHSFVIPYWEGSITASGSHKARGYMHLSGY